MTGKCVRQVMRYCSNTSCSLDYISMLLLHVNLKQAKIWTHLLCWNC